jgi:hypothetical protein
LIRKKESKSRKIERMQGKNVERKEHDVLNTTKNKKPRMPNEKWKEKLPRRQKGKKSILGSGT